MRCKICNKELQEGELHAKDTRTGEFLDTCGKCKSVTYLQQFEFDLTFIHDKPTLGVDE